MSDDDRGLPHGINGRRTVTAAFIILLIVILITIFLLVYTRWKARLVVRRRYRIQHLNMGALAAQTQIPEPPKRGLDPSIIATLPIFIYKKGDPLNDNRIECSVCLSALEEGEMARLLPNCTHMFHAQCINMWLHSHSTCPICRTGAEPLVQEVVEVPVAAASAPPLDHTSSMNSEGPSGAVVDQPLKAAESSSR